MVNYIRLSVYGNFNLMLVILTWLYYTFVVSYLYIIIFLIWVYQPMHYTTCFDHQPQHTITYLKGKSPSKSTFSPKKIKRIMKLILWYCIKLIILSSLTPSSDAWDVSWHNLYWSGILGFLLLSGLLRTPEVIAISYFYFSIIYNYINIDIGG